MSINKNSLRPFFGFYGGKWRDAVKHYPPPTHDVIVEPFAGSAGYSLRYYDRRVILYEIDPVLCAVWDYLIRVKPSEILSIPDVPLAKDDQALNGQPLADWTVEDMDIPQEARWLVGFWMNRGTASPRKRPSKWMRDGIRPGSFWGDRVRRTIAGQVEAIRHWEIRECSYTGITEYPRATWFVDPPYQVAGKHYKHGSEGIDFAHLGEWCQCREGQVIVCENEGADWLPFRDLADVKTTRAGQRSKEVIWTAASTTALAVPE